MIYGDPGYDAFKMIVTKTNDDLIKYIEDTKKETNSQDYSKFIFSAFYSSFLYSCHQVAHCIGQYSSMIRMCKKPI